MIHLQRHLRVSDEHMSHLKVAFASSDMKTVNQHLAPVKVCWCMA
jgi:nitrogen fixation protein NifX